MHPQALIMYCLCEAWNYFRICSSQARIPVAPLDRFRKTILEQWTNNNCKAQLLLNNVRSSQNLVLDRLTMKSSGNVKNGNRLETNFLETGTGFFLFPNPKKSCLFFICLHPGRPLLECKQFFDQIQVLMRFYA